MATILCFKTGEVLKPNEIPKPSDYINKRNTLLATRESDRIGFWKRTIEDIESRYEGCMPKQGCVYKQSLKTAIFDTYGYGCVHNSIHQYRGGQYWNKPFPMPADLPKIEVYLKRFKGKFLRLGSKSDPFMWIDQKYQITKSVLEIANENDVQLIIHTMSDLCAHDDYAILLKRGGHSIVMQMGFEDLRLRTEPIERAVSPGAPSLKRRQLAVEKLAKHGVDVEICFTHIDEILNNKTKVNYFRRSTGIWLTKDLNLDLLSERGAR